jgi:hypothetical protein
MPIARIEGGLVTNSSTVPHEVWMLIDGQLVEASSGATFENLDPATKDVLGVVPGP